MITSKILTFIKALYGIVIKIRYSLFSWNSCRLPSKGSGGELVIISLTSYGRRVDTSLPYVLISLLKQTRLPDRIVVWLDRSWADENLPKKLLGFKKNGVEFNYCEDYKSYKKLIPALSEYPKDIIITCDDDLFYDKHMVERLLNAHEKYPNTICCQLAHGIRYCGEKLQPYNQWDEEIYDVDKNVFPLGGSVCLYKKDFLYKDVVNYDLAKELCPKADDVWFFFMGLLKGSKRYVLPYTKDCVIPLDAFYQFFHRGASLMEDNLSQGMNDKQISTVMEHYSVNSKMISGNENYNNNAVL